MALFFLYVVFSVQNMIHKKNKIIRKNIDFYFVL